MFFQLPYGIFAVSIITAIFPAMSEYAALKKWPKFKETMNLGIRSTILIIVPACVIYLTLNQTIIRFLLQHGFFHAGDTQLLASVLFFMALGLIPYSVDMLLTKTFYSLQDTRTPMIINCFVVAINMGANYLFFHLMGVKGLALAFAVAYFFSMLIDGTVLRFRLGRIEGRRILTTAAKTIAAAAVMASVTYGARYGIEQIFIAESIWRDLLALLVPLLLGVFAFVAMARLLRVEELPGLMATVLSYARKLRHPGPILTKKENNVTED